MVPGYKWAEAVLWLVTSAMFFAANIVSFTNLLRHGGK